jgi:hypothetical protein
MTDFAKAIEEAKAESLPYESWEQLTGETSLAYTAFCAYRDMGPQRNVRKAVDATEKDEAARPRRYRVWRNWSTCFRWRERAEGYDRYLERLKQTELRKTIEEQGKVHREITGKMLQVVGKKLDTMKAEDLTQNNVTSWVETAIRAEREAAGLVTSNGKTEPKQGELIFSPDFQGL